MGKFSCRNKKVGLTNFVFDNGIREKIKVVKIPKATATMIGIGKIFISNGMG